MLTYNHDERVVMSVNVKERWLILGLSTAVRRPSVNGLFPLHALHAAAVSIDCIRCSCTLFHPDSGEKGQTKLFRGSHTLIVIP